MSAEPIYFVDGCVREEGYIFLSARLKSVDADEYDFTRTFSSRIPTWGHWDLNWNVLSVCHATSSDLLCALSDKGDVRISKPAVSSIEEKITDVESLGAVKQIREIGGLLHVCGDQGQVYRRQSDGSWVHIDDGILDREIKVDALDLNGIDGTSLEDIYVVGMKGRILHFDGSAWTELDSPTNLHLERVHCVSPDEAYACGNRGTFLRITKQGIEDLSLDLEDHFWGLTAFQGQIYLATLKGLFVYDGTSVEPVETGLEPPIGGYRLDACETQLWSFGVDDLAYFDGTTWTRVQHPDNV